MTSPFDHAYTVPPTLPKITASRRTGSRRILSIVNLPVSAAVPEFSFSGAINLQPSHGYAAIARAASTSPCDGPKTFNAGASPDQFQIRQASATLFPEPEMSLEVAARTTEHAGANALAVGVSCSWTLATIGPWRAEIPTPIVPIPVYAQIPLTADADILGSLSAFQLNLASTHDMTLDLGHYNHFSLQEQGSNIWTSGVMAWSGQADLDVKLAVQFGIGDPKIGNFHLDVGIGAEAAFNTNKTCEVDFIPGTLDAGVKLGPFAGTTTLWSAKKYPLWQGCKGGGGGGGGGGTVTLGTLGDQTSPVGTPVTLQLHATDTASGSLIYSATGLPPGLSIDATTGLISGTPATVGSYTPSVFVQDSTGPSAQQQFGWNTVSGGTQIHATAIAAGWQHACALLSTGAVDCWGDDGDGELGIGTTSGPSTCSNGSEPCSPQPVQVTGITNATQVTAGSGFSCALLSTGRVDCWGDNGWGQLGNGTTGGPDCDGQCIATPVPVNGITNAIEIASANGASHVCALLSGGHIECWGHNDYGQLGNGTRTDSDVPVAVSGISTATHVAAGSMDSCAVLSGGAADCWGDDQFGELGNGTTVTQTGDAPCNPGNIDGCSTVPLAADNLTNASQLSAGDQFECAVLSTGAVDCWGANYNGTLGDGTSSGPDSCGSGGDPCSTTPVQVAGITDATQVGAGGGSVCAALSSGEVECWGADNVGQLGTGSTTGPDSCSTQPCSTTPLQVSTITDASAIATGDAFSCAMLSTGLVDCWGDDQFGALGDDGTANSDLPVQVSSFQ